MINAAPTPGQVPEKPSVVKTPPVAPPTFPTHNPAQQHLKHVGTNPAAPVAAPKSNLSASPAAPSSSPVMPTKPKFPDPTKKTFVKADGSKAGGDYNKPGSDSIKPKSKMNIKMILGVVVLLLIVLGSGAGFFLSQQSQDLRQQAYAPVCGPNLSCQGSPLAGGSACTASNQGEVYCCPAGVTINNGSCGGTTPTTQPTTPATTQPTTPTTTGDDPGNMIFGISGPGYAGKDPNIVGVCDWNTAVKIKDRNGVLYQSGDKVETTAGFRYLGNDRTLFCSKIRNVKEFSLTILDTNSFHCPEKQPEIACNIPSANVGCSTDRDPDAIGGGLENTKIVIQPFSSYIRCDEYYTPGGPCGLAQGDWRFDGNVHNGDPFGIIYNMGSRCEITYNCFEPCTTTDQCQQNGSTNVCDQASKLCVNSNNPTSDQCLAPETLVCNDACTSTAQCQTDIDINHSCVAGFCRLTDYPEESSCVVPDPLVCDDACTSTAQCQTDIDINHSCVAGFCRLTDYPEESSCVVPDPLVCDDTCNPNAVTDICTLGANGANNSCITLDDGISKCRRTDYPELAEPTSSCDPEPLVCFGPCDPEAATDLCTAVNTSWSCNATTSTCTHTVNTTDPNCLPEPDAVTCNEACSTDFECEKDNESHSCIDSVCRLTENPGDINCEVEPPSCNEHCDNNAQCQKGDPGHICDIETNKCRLESNPGDINCEIAESSPGCNDICENNADCSDSNHVCSTTEDGSKRCRLNGDVESTTCTLTTATTQPSLPEALPETGPADWLNWMKAGIVTIGVGAALFFLL